MGITEILTRIWLFSANKIKISESFSKQPTQLIVELNSSLRHIIVTHDSTDLKNCSGILASNSKYLDCYFQYLVELFWYLVQKKDKVTDIRRV